MYPKKSIIPKVTLYFSKQLFKKKDKRNLKRVEQIKKIKEGIEKEFEKSEIAKLKNSSEILETSTTQQSNLKESYYNNLTQEHSNLYLKHIKIQDSIILDSKDFASENAKKVNLSQKLINLEVKYEYAKNNSSTIKEDNKENTSNSNSDYSLIKVVNISCLDIENTEESKKVNITSQSQTIEKRGNHMLNVNTVNSSKEKDNKNKCNRSYGKLSKKKQIIKKSSQNSLNNTDKVMLKNTKKIDKINDFINDENKNKEGSNTKFPISKQDPEFQLKYSYNKKDSFIKLENHLTVKAKSIKNEFTKSYQLVLFPNLSPIFDMDFKNEIIRETYSGMNPIKEELLENDSSVKTKKIGLNSAAATQIKKIKKNFTFINQSKNKKVIKNKKDNTTKTSLNNNLKKDNLSSVTKKNIKIKESTKK